MYVINETHRRRSRRAFRACAARVAVAQPTFR